MKNLFEGDDSLTFNIDEQDNDENTPLHLACANNHKKAVRVLVEAGASVFSRGEYGYTPLHSYARY